MKTSNKKTIVVNIIGGPGTGKSILASELFSSLKRLGITCDVSWEYIKRKIRERAMKVVESQIYLFGKQQFQLFTMKDEVEVVITDSPLLLNSVYDSSNCEYLKKLVIKEYNKYNNLLYLIERDETVGYETEGRFQDFNGAKKIDVLVKDFLIDNNIEYKTINGIGEESKKLIIDDVIKILNSEN